MKAHSLLASLILVANSLPLGGAERQPNVLIFLMDDMGYGDVRSLNPDGAGFTTPNLDELVASGVTFSQAHSSASVCAPTRYALLTGNHVYRGRLPGGTWSHFAGSQILSGQQTIADRLRDAGYTTAFFGKGHLGSIFLRKDGTPAKDFGDADLSQPFQDGPRDHGFDYSLTLPAGIQSEPYAFFQNDRLTRWNNERMVWNTFESDKEARQHFRTQKRGKKNSVYAMDNWSTETVGPLLIRDALGFIDRHVVDKGKQQPFYIHYCSQAGHAPFAPPVAFNPNDPLNTSELAAPGAVAIAGQTVNKRTDMIFEGDVALGLFVKKLSELGILEDTLILFTSDNGAAVGLQSTWSKPIYRDVKDGIPYGGNRLEVSELDSQRVHQNAQGVAGDGSPLRGEKGFVYEGGHRIPFIVRWDNGIPANRVVRDQIIGLHDVFATIAAIAGAKVDSDQAHDSYDFSKVWQDPAAKHPLVRNSLFIQSNRPWEQNNKKSNNTWAAYQATQSANSLDLWKGVLETNVRKPDGKARANGVELFHLTKDPSESNNLIDASRLKAIERQFRTQSNQFRTAP
ncbi:MAG: sulfatase-like hydrolase/transferase [Rubripirellula sp.]